MRALITGASKGIGKATAFAFAADGFDLMLGARNEENLKKVQQDLLSANPGIDVCIKPCDFSSREDIRKFADFVLAKWDSINVLVNNVGVYSVGMVSEEDDDALDTMLRTNLFSAYRLTRSLLPLFKMQKSGHIFNICSIASKVPRPEAASYTISKYAMYGFSKVLAEEMRKYRVKVTSVLPGPTFTSSWNDDTPDKNKLIQPEDIASSILCACKLSPFTVMEELIIEPVNTNY